MTDLMTPLTPRMRYTGTREARVPDPAIAGRNRRSRARGKRTSHELAAYLGGQDVEGLLWPWDVQGPGYRVQSKRLAALPSLAQRVVLLRYIGESDALRALYLVAPRQRLASGSIWALLQEWVAVHGWSLPSGAHLANAGGEALIELPLPDFRDIHVGAKP